MLRYADFRLDASTLQTLPDGSIKVVGQLTHPGIFDYRNPDGSRRREYRPADEVFRQESMRTFASSTITVNHPPVIDGERLVNTKNWKSLAIGHVGENVREDAGHMVADLYIRDAAAVERVKNGDLRHISCGYNVEFDPTPGTTPDGQRYDGVQRNIRGNHVALLPNGIAPRGGSECVLRLDSAGDEITSALSSYVDLETLKAKVAALEGELEKSRADAKEVPTLKAALETANQKVADLEAQVAPERLDSLLEARGSLVAQAKSVGVDAKGKSALAIKRAIVAKRTPSLASRVDSMSEASIDGAMAVYAELPHPSMNVLGENAEKAGTAGERSDAAAEAPAIPKVADLYDKSVQASQNAWKNTGEKVGR